ADDMFLLGLPGYSRGSWLRWALPLAGVVLLAVIGIALWQSLPGVQQPPSNRVASRGDSSDGQKTPAEPIKTKNEPESDGQKTPAEPIKTKNEPEPVGQPAVTGGQKTPSNERAEVGSYFFGPKSLPSILVQGKQGKQDKQDGWHRLKP